ncbi:MAG: O-antigen ligase family protein [Capsulimonas sp.]|uniref:O-antigen ligase family protein n=1 Tax=Capsulimonas sp. TaxID=2494211 RepID=UPI0032655727
MTDIVLCVWLIIGYFLPNTYFYNCSAKFLVGYSYLYVSQTIITILVISAAAILMLRILRESIGSSSIQLYCGLIAFFAVYIYAAVYKLYTGGLNTGEVSLLIAFCIGLLASRILNISNVILIICLLGAVQSLFMVYYSFHHVHVIVSGNVIRSAGTFSDLSEMYGIFVVTIPLAASICMSKVRSLRILGLSCLLFLVIGFTMTWYRGAALGIAAGLIWLFAQCPFSARKRLFMILSTLLFLTVVMFVRVHDHVSSSSSTRSIASRQTLFRAGAASFIKHPVFGLLLSDINFPVEKKIPYVDLPTIKLVNHPYNQFLFFLDKMGAIGLILMCWFGYGIFRALSRRREPIPLSISAAWVALLTAGFTDTLFGVPSADHDTMNMLVGLLIGLTLISSSSAANTLLVSNIDKKTEFGSCELLISPSLPR